MKYDRNVMMAIKEEVEREFALEYGLGEELDEEELYEEEPQAETLESVINDCLSAYMEESVAHFLAARSRKMEDDGRYFYWDEELEDFKTRFTNEGGDLNTLHIGAVYVKNGETYNQPVEGTKFLCYEVCRKKYYDMETYYSHQKYDEGSGARNKIFFS